MVIVYILAAIGGICLLGFVGLMIMVSLTPTEAEEEKEITCALTDEKCIYTSSRAACAGCPIAEEADKIGDR